MSWDTNIWLHIPIYYKGYCMCTLLCTVNLIIEIQSQLLQFGSQSRSLAWVGRNLQFNTSSRGLRKQLQTIFLNLNFLSFSKIFLIIQFNSSDIKFDNFVLKNGVTICFFFWILSKSPYPKVPYTLYSILAGILLF